MPDDDREALEAALRRGDVVAHHAARHPDRPAIVSRTERRTYAELSGRANQLSRALRAAGLGAGDAVALMCTNRSEFAETFVATQQAGLRLTPINFHLLADEATYIATDCEAKAFIVDASLGETAVDLGERIIGKKGPAVRLSIGGTVPGFESYDGFIKPHSAERLADPVLGGLMLYTSGTTGRPKGVFRAKPEPVATATLDVYGYGDDAVSLCTGPLYHAAPMTAGLNVPLAGGVTIVLMGKWDAEETLRLIDEFKVTHSHMVPTMFHRLLALPDDVRGRYDVSSLQFILHGAAPCPVEVKQRLMAWWGPIVWEYYAATEGGGTLIAPNDWLAHPGTVGKPLPGEDVYVGDDDGRPLPAGEAGLVWIRRADRNPFEYFHDPNKTSSTYRGEYFTLGDVGYVDGEGYLFLTDRSANLIISGGVNIYPAEVDATLLGHPAVEDVAVIGVPNDEWGEEVLAVVQLHPSAHATDALADELIEWCRARLASYKCPRRVDFVDDLPRQDNGKIYKRLLRERYRKPGGDA